MTGFVGIVCGLKTEGATVIRAIGRDKIRVRISGANAARAEKIAETFIREGAAAIVSIGVSGGLDPSLEPGDLIIGDDVIDDTEGGRYESDRYLIGAIKKEEVAQGAKHGTIFGSDDIVDSVSRKATLHSNHNAMAVDMESHGAARAAAKAGVPFLAIRAIADPADRALPTAALNAIAEDGSTRMVATIAAAMADPQQFPELMKLGKDNAAALKTLRRSLGPLFRRLFLSLDL